MKVPSKNVHPSRFMQIIFPADFYFDKWKEIERKRTPHFAELRVYFCTKMLICNLYQINWLINLPIV